MFRSVLHGTLRLLMFAPFCAAGTTPAMAADVDEVHFIVTIAKSSEVADEITAEIRVKGTEGFVNGTIQFPSALGTIALQDDGDDLARGISFQNEAELAAAMPNGNYVLRANNATLQATIAYQREAVPSPAISQPDAGDVLAPGPVELLFTACPVCNLAGDSVDAALEGDAAATETLSASHDSWVPPDGMGGDLALPEDGEFLARITHTAMQQSNVAVSGQVPLAVFTNTFIRSDEVGFRTGFEPPVGDFCLAVNDPAPPAGCSPLADPLLFLLDTSGTFQTTVDGHDVDYDLTVGEKGQLTGHAMADLDDDGSQESVGAVKGKLKGKGGELKQKLAFPLANEALLAKLKVRVSDLLSIPSASLERVQKSSGRIGATKLEEEVLEGGALPFTPLFWRVEFTIAADGAVQDGLLTLDGDRTFDLVGTHKFKLATDLSNLKLQSTTKGIKLQLKKVELDDQVSPTAVVGGTLSYKILGQSGKAPLP